MVIGNGLLAQAFKQYENDDQVIIFASGVSNSRETRESEFEREGELLKSLKSEKILVYFSTCSVYDPTMQMTKYVMHKMHMERMVKHLFANSIIFRLPNVIGHTNNPNTFFNFLKNKIINNDFFPVYYDATRYLIDIDDLTLLLPGIIEKHKTDNIKHENLDVCFNNKTNVLKIVEMMLEILKKETQPSIVSGGCDYYIPRKEFSTYLQSINYVEPENYTYNLLKKYL